MRSRVIRSVKGFTLIEMMVTVAIVAILATIAIPSYTSYVLRGHRAAAKTQMMDIAAREQQYLLANRRYAATGSALSYTLPTELSNRYEFEITVNEEGDVPSFLISFIAIGPQLSDGVLTLDNFGNKTPLAKWQK